MKFAKGFVAAAAVGISTPLCAAESVDLGPVVSLACAGLTDEKVEKPLPLHRLAEALLIQAGYPPSRILPQEALAPEAYRDRLLAAIRGDDPVVIDPAARRKLNQHILKLEQEIGPKSHVSEKARGMKVTVGKPSEPSLNWLFSASNPVELACMPAKLPSGTAMDYVETQRKTEVPRFGIIKKVEDLGLAGNDRKKAEAASVGLKRVRTEEDDGSRKTTTSLTFDGTVGLRLTGQYSKTRSAFAYANYTIARERVKPAPPLDPGKERDDNDTHGLALGGLVDDIPIGPIAIVPSASYVFDFVKHSRRGVLSARIDFGWNMVDLGFCSLGGLRPISIGGIDLRTQCYLGAQVDYSHVFKVGEADFKKRGDFLSAGPVIGIDLAPPIFEGSGVVGSLRYRYLPTISGTAPDVSRWDASLKYRWWLPAGGALDIGFTYKRGEELKTYTNEDSLELSFGVIF